MGRVFEELGDAVSVKVTERNPLTVYGAIRKVEYKDIDTTAMQ